MSDDNRRIREEILSILAAHPGSLCSRTARAYRAAWDDEQTCVENKIVPKTVRQQHRRVHLFLEGVVPHDAPSYADQISHYYRDALNFTDLLSEEAIVYAVGMLTELRSLNPKIPNTPLQRQKQPTRVGRPTATRTALMCGECFTTHVGDCL